MERCGGPTSQTSSSGGSRPTSVSCSTCTQALSKFSVKGHLHPWAEVRPPPSRVLGEVELDVSGRLSCPSLPYVGARGNQRGGGNEYFVLYRDVKSSRLFESFIRTKDELEDETWPS